MSSHCRRVRRQSTTWRMMEGTECRFCRAADSWAAAQHAFRDSVLRAAL